MEKWIQIIFQFIYTKNLQYQILLNRYSRNPLLTILPTKQILDFESCIIAWIFKNSQ